MAQSEPVSQVDKLITRPRGVFILGRHSLQNKLLARLIDERLGILCLVRAVDDINNLPITANGLVLLDLEGQTIDDVTVSFRVLSGSPRCHSIAIVNADESGPFERYVVWPKLKGVFLRETSEENLLKGIQAILNDECWLPRRMLTAYLERTRSRRHVSCIQNALTPKEIATLKLLVGGDSNSHIAQQLNVSPHTVKTHLYNVFRKIKVDNRVQAVHWALQHIDGVEVDSR